MNILLSKSADKLLCASPDQGMHADIDLKDGVCDA